MGRASILRTAVHAFVEQHALGIEQEVVTHHFRNADRWRVVDALQNLQQEGLIHNTGRRGAPMWKPGLSPHKPVPLSAVQAKKLERARLMDQRDPLVFYGQGLQPPRCPSVWAYARSFQESRA
jgi:hypothetical protein